MKVNKKYLVDLAERVATTAAFAFISAVSFQDIQGTWRLGATAAGAAALSLLKGSLARYVGDDSPGIK